MSAYLHALALSVLSHPILTLACVWALLCPLCDYLPENRR
jgi:hypothetical protein